MNLEAAMPKSIDPAESIAETVKKQSPGGDVQKPAGRGAESTESTAVAGRPVEATRSCG